MCQVSVEELWWARVASLLDAEGCIRKNQACIDIRMCDKDLIQMCFDVTGVRNNMTVRTLKSGKLQYGIYITGKDQVERCLKRMLPYLGERRTQQANNLLNWIAKSPNKRHHIQTIND